MKRKALSRGRFSTVDTWQLNFSAKYRAVWVSVPPRYRQWSQLLMMVWDFAEP